ncbi:gamma-glutamylcyclotransferase family protein [Pontibacter sp. G13]|uniref:gamma-glutamylcyclotransferase family protein n=1 Tax=Pontibacter sp. G13 TaxID=3074898 RepID=UPI00288B85D0|nr:gamma-glutamylcyclotransferase family protein [Pontibacter sp. G13]WNJ19524.1 gamma-glutamylcyclotransferase family protein [Pontibacter sp. G13]
MHEAEAYPLFVYGTLMRQTDNIMSEFLSRKATLVGPASMPGHIYKINFFPGATYDRYIPDRVKGELYTLSDPKIVWQVLDRYEGYDPQDEEHSLFVRSLCEVETPNGIWHTSWVYLYNLPVEEYPRIQGGDFLEYEQNRA